MGIPPNREAASSHGFHRRLGTFVFFRSCLVAACVLAISCHGEVFAWELRFDHPANYIGSWDGGPAVHEFDTRQPIHEQLTLISLGCWNNSSCKDQLAGYSISLEDVIRGVRWSDFPSVYFTKSPTGTCLGLRRPSKSSDLRCLGATVFYSGGLSREIKGDKYSNETIFVRGHFGDLQAWHAMASRGEQPKETLDAMMAWAKLWWSVVRREVNLRADITIVADAAVAKRFHRGSRQVHNFVDYRLDKNVRSVALGAILHMVQDSFAPCHTERDSLGRIARFNSYYGQSTDKHQEHDGSAQALKHVISLPNGPTVIGQRLVELAMESASWEAVQVQLLKAWPLSSEAQVAAPGTLCSKQPE